MSFVEFLPEVVEKIIFLKVSWHLLWWYLNFENHLQKWLIYWGKRNRINTLLCVPSLLFCAWRTFPNFRCNIKSANFPHFSSPFLKNKLFSGIPLNKEGVCSPAEIKIRSLKEGGRPNPKRLQLITISSPKSSKEENLDENDLNLVLEEPTPSPKSEKNKKRVQLISLDKKNNTTDQIKNNCSSTSNSTNDSTAVAANKKRVPFVTLSK